MPRYSLRTLMKVVLLVALVTYLAHFWWTYLRPHGYLSPEDVLAAAWSVGVAALLTIGFASAAPQAGKIARLTSLAVTMLVSAYLCGPALYVMSQPERAIAHYIQGILVNAFAAAITWKCVMAFAPPWIARVESTMKWLVDNRT